MPAHIRNIVMALIFTVVTQSSCSDVETPISLVDEVTPVSMTGYTESAYSVYTKTNEYMPAPAEPSAGCYIGAYVLSNTRVNFDMMKFDKLTGKTHALSVQSMRLGEKFPYDWVLECIANMKTPYIIVHPPSEFAVFKDELLIQAAKDFSQLPVPIFVDFYPDPHKYTDNSALYKDFYKEAYDVFKLNAPNTIFVLSANSENVYDLDFYYPGDNYVDWLGLSMYVPLYQNGSDYRRDYMKDLDYFYSAYQRKKPIIISQLAFSSYSSMNHRYFSAESSEKLTEFYKALKDDYTRIKAVNYMDLNNIDNAPKAAERDDFSITQNEIMLNSYKNVINDSYFLEETKAGANGEITEFYKSFIPVLEDENSKYISEKVFSNELHKTPDIPCVVINGENYYSTEDLSRSNIECVIDTEMNKIILE